MKFCERLKEIRIEHGLNQRALAELCKLSPQSISSFESGINSPTVPSLFALADALNVSIDYLLGRIDEDEGIVSLRNPVRFSSVEERLIENFRRLPAQSQEYVFGIVQNLAAHS